MLSLFLLQINLTKAKSKRDLAKEGAMLMIYSHHHFERGRKTKTDNDGISRDH